MKDTVDPPAQRSDDPAHGDAVGLMLAALEILDRSGAPGSAATLSLAIARAGGSVPLLWAADGDAPRTARLD